MCIIVEIKLGETGCIMKGGLDSCEDIHAGCDEGTKCICDDGYYDSNGTSNLYGTCQLSK